MSRILSRSTNALGETEQVRFSALGAFAPEPADFDAAALQAVWDVEAVLPTLRTLVDRGLVETEIGTGRFRVHPLVAQHAKDLGGRFAGDGAHERHAKHYHGVLKRSNELVEQGQETTGLTLFDRDRRQVVAAFRWAAENTQRSTGAAALCSAFAYDGELVIYLRLLASDRIRWGNAAAAAAGRIGDRAAEAAHLHKLAMAYLDAGTLSPAFDLEERSLAINRELGRAEYEASNLGGLGLLHAAAGDHAAAIACYEQALRVYATIDAPWGEGIYWGNLGDSLVQAGRPERALEVLERALELSRSVGDRRSEGFALGYQGKAFAAMAKHDVAAAKYAEQLEIAHSMDDPQSAGYAELGLSRSHAALGDRRSAVAHAENALTALDAIGDAAAQDCRRQLEALRSV